MSCANCKTTVFCVQAKAFSFSSVEGADRLQIRDDMGNNFQRVGVVDNTPKARWPAWPCSFLCRKSTSRASCSSRPVTSWPVFIRHVAINFGHNAWHPTLTTSSKQSTTRQVNETLNVTYTHIQAHLLALGKEADRERFELPSQVTTFSVLTEQSEPPVVEISDSISSAAWSKEGARYAQTMEVRRE